MIGLLLMCAFVAAFLGFFVGIPVARYRRAARATRSLAARLHLLGFTVIDRKVAPRRSMLGAIALTHDIDYCHFHCGGSNRPVCRFSEVVEAGEELATWHNISDVCLDCGTIGHAGGYGEIGRRMHTRGNFFELVDNLEAERSLLSGVSAIEDRTSDQEFRGAWRHPDGLSADALVR